MAKYSEGEEVCFDGKHFARITIEGDGGGLPYLLEEEIGGSMFNGVKTYWVPEVDLHYLTYAQRLARIEEALDLD